MRHSAQHGSLVSGFTVSTLSRRHRAYSSLRSTIIPISMSGWKTPHSATSFTAGYFSSFLRRAEELRPRVPANRTRGTLIDLQRHARTFRLMPPLPFSKCQIPRS